MASKKRAKKSAKRFVKKVPKKALKKVVKKIAKRTVAKKRGRGRPRGFGPAPREFKDRFQKFYYVHRDDLNDERRSTYKRKKIRRICVRCKRMAVKGSVFCAQHRKMSRKYNRK